MLQQLEEFVSNLADRRRLYPRDFRQLFRAYAGFHDEDDAVLRL